MKKKKNTFDNLYGIIWHGERPSLWIRFETYKNAHVINGAWDLCDFDTDKRTYSIIGPNGGIMRKDVSYDRLTYAGDVKNKDYNQVLCDARTANLVDLDLAFHNLANNYDELYEETDEEEDEIPF